MKVAVLYNARYGGFGFSKKAEKLYCAAKGIEWTEKFNFKRYSNRTDPDMVQIVQNLGAEANNHFSNILVELIPKKYENYYYIDDYDGFETVKIDFKQYRLDQVQDVLGNDSLAAEDIVLQIRDIFAKDLESDEC